MNSSQQLLIAVRLHCIDAFYCYTCMIFHGLCFSASVWGILVNPAKVDELIEMPLVSD